MNMGAPVLLGTGSLMHDGTEAVLMKSTYPSQAFMARLWQEVGLNHDSRVRGEDASRCRGMLR